MITIQVGCYYLECTIMSLVPTSLMLKVGLHWYLLAALLPHLRLLVQWFPSFRTHLELLLNHRLLGSSPMVSDSVGLRWGPRLCISNKFSRWCWSCWSRKRILRTTVLRKESKRQFWEYSCCLPPQKQVLQAVCLLHTQRGTHWDVFIYMGPLQ